MRPDPSSGLRPTDIFFHFVTGLARDVDAGTPGISDPGLGLAAQCAARAVPVVPVPGACAAVALPGGDLGWGFGTVREPYAYGYGV